MTPLEAWLEKRHNIENMTYDLVAEHNKAIAIIETLKAALEESNKTLCEKGIVRDGFTRINALRKNKAALEMDPESL